MKKKKKSYQTCFTMHGTNAASAILAAVLVSDKFECFSFSTA